MRRPTFICYCDWSKDAPKRWLAKAVLDGDGRYVAYAPKQVGNPGTLIAELRADAGSDGCVRLCSHSLSLSPVLMQDTVCNCNGDPMKTGQNANTLAHAVNEAAGNQYTPRPYNRFDPDDTTWWLVPGADWPAFRYAKFFFHAKPGDIPEGLNGIYCGISVEKGLSLKVKDFYPKELIKSSQWDWDAVIRNLGAHWPTSTTSPFLSVSLSYIPPDGSVSSVDSFLDLKKTFRASHAFFTVSPELRVSVHGTPYLNDRCFEIAEHFRTRILPSADVTELVRGLESFPQSDWCWIDLYIGRVWSGEASGSLWNHDLKPWCCLLPQSRTVVAGT